MSLTIFASGSTLIDSSSLSLTLPLPFQPFTQQLANHGFDLSRCFYNTLRSYTRVLISLYTSLWDSRTWSTDCLLILVYSTRSLHTLSLPPSWPPPSRSNQSLLIRLEATLRIWREPPMEEGEGTIKPDWVRKVWSWIRMIGIVLKKI